MKLTYANLTIKPVALQILQSKNVSFTFDALVSEYLGILGALHAFRAHFRRDPGEAAGEKIRYKDGQIVGHGHRLLGKLGAKAADLEAVVVVRHASTKALARTVQKFEISEFCCCFRRNRTLESDQLHFILRYQNFVRFSQN